MRDEQIEVQDVATLWWWFAQLELIPSKMHGLWQHKSAPQYTDTTKSRWLKNTRLYKYTWCDHLYPIWIVLLKKKQSSWSPFIYRVWLRNSKRQRPFLLHDTKNKCHQRSSLLPQSSRADPLPGIVAPPPSPAMLSRCIKTHLHMNQPLKLCPSTKFSPTTKH